ncbi:MAG: N-acetyltransferase family protein [Halolamina sp.]
MRVRDAAPADAEAVATVARASWHAAYDDLLGAETVAATVDRWYDPPSLRAEIAAADGAERTGDSATSANGPSFFLVAEGDGEVVGFTNAGPSGENAPADAFISRLYVHPDRWGAGVGSALTGRVARRLRDAGYERVWLEVFAENDVGRGFYESRGFERVGSAAEQFGGAERRTLHLATELSALVKATPAVE